MAKKRNSDKSAQKLSFEQAAARLDEIGDRLESGKLELEETLSEYEQSVGLLKHCYSLLEKAESRIKLLTAVDEDGQAQLADFDDSATAMDETGKSRAKKRSSGVKRKNSDSGQDESSLF